MDGFKIVFSTGLGTEFVNSHTNARPGKGHYLPLFPNDYVVIDLETTGLSPQFDEIIEVAALRVSNGKIVDSYSELVRPVNPIDDFIVELTGISNEMVADARPVEMVLPDFCGFVSDSILVGHNVSFDINFIYDSLDCFSKEFSNDYVDTMHLSRRILPDLKHHRLSDLSKLYIDEDYSAAHRALEDCYATYSVFNGLRSDAITKFGSLEDFYNSCKRKSSHAGFKAAEISPDNVNFDESHPLFGRLCVFTGKLEKMSRREAMQLVVNLGGFVGDSVTKKTNYLILGNNDYCATIKDGKSSKQKKAEKLISDGCDLSIMPESVFYDLVFGEL